MSKDIKQNIAIVACIAFLLISGTYIYNINNAKTEAEVAARADESFQKVADQIAIGSMEDMARESQSKAYADAIREVQEEERLRVHTIASSKQHKRMTELYGVYQRIIDDLKKLQSEVSEKAVRRLEVELRLAVMKDQWSEVDYWIRDYNKGVDEQYRIKMLDCPVSSLQ